MSAGNQAALSRGSERGHIVPFTLAVAAAVLLIDQLAKGLVMARLAAGDTITVIPHLLNLTLVRNPGAAYGLLAGGRWFLTAVAVIMVGVALYLAPRLSRHWQQVALGLMVGGALGNMLDRVRWGLVTDFLQIPPLPIFQVFNFADLAITAAVVLVALEWVLDRSSFD